MSDKQNTRNQRSGPRGGGRGPSAEKEKAPSEFAETLVHINRNAKVVKGGRRFSFAALVVVGDGKGRIGVGTGKAQEVPEAIRKATEQAYKEVCSISLRGTTISHDVLGQADGGRVLLRPATPGTGVVAGGGARAVLNAVGVKDVLSKSLRSSNPAAVVQATLNALKQLRTGDQVRALRRANASVMA